MHPGGSTNLFAIPFKRPVDDEKLSSRLAHCIVQAYGEPVEPYREDLRILDDMRNEASTVADLNLKQIQRLQRYYAQLTYVATKFPYDVCPGLAWSVCFPETKARSSVQQLGNLHFERATLLFNMAAMYSQLALCEDRRTVTGLKQACAYFQLAVGVLTFLRDHVVTDLRDTPPEDLQPSMLNVLISTMQAQAQECFWQKAVTDQRKDSVVAKLSVQTSQFYQQAYEGAQLPNTRTLLPSTWHTQLLIKRIHFEAATQFRISRECLEHNRYGEEICRLQWAATSVQTLISHPMVQGVSNSPTGELRGNMDSDTLPGTINWDLVRQRLQYETETLHHVLQDLESLRTTLTTNLQRAEKDNDIIYLDHVPEFSSLPPVTGVSLVNPQIPAEISDSMAYMGSTTVLGTPLLAGLLPFAVHQAVSLYHDRKQQLVATQVVEPLETLSVQCQSFIESLDLNYLIASTRTPTDIPSTITQAAQDVQKRGGYTFLDKHLAAAHALAQRCTEELTNCQYKLANLPQDTSSFSPQRELVPGYYPSASSTEDPQVGERGTIWKEQYRAHERALQDAQTNDKALRKRLTAWQPFIQLLEGPSAQLVAALPSTIGVTLLPSERNVVDEVATLLQELRRRCVHDRPVFMDKVRLVCDQDDIGPALTKTLHQLSLSSSATLLKVEPYQFEDTFSDQLQKYNPHIQHVQREEELQNTLMTRLTGLRQHIVALRDKYPPLVQREKAYHNLSTACQKFQELITLGSEVQQFYRNLEEQLHSLASEILPG